MFAMRSFRATLMTSPGLARLPQADPRFPKLKQQLFTARYVNPGNFAIGLAIPTERYIPTWLYVNTQIASRHACSSGA
jgi:hypothetical protein